MKKIQISGCSRHDPGAERRKDPEKIVPSTTITQGRLFVVSGSDGTLYSIHKSEFVEFLRLGF